MAVKRQAEIKGGEKLQNSNKIIKRKSYRLIVEKALKDSRPPK